MENTRKETIGVFGHYGNKNLGDEAIIAAVVHHIRSFSPESTIIGFSINPEDTRERHHIRSYPIRRLKRDKRSPGAAGHRIDDGQADGGSRDNRSGSGRLRQSLKDSLNKTAILKPLLKSPFTMIKGLVAFYREIYFIVDAYHILKNIDKLLICGSNQFLDNFGGAMGFPYTLLKWTLLARCAKTKVYFLSLGAGPIKRRLSMFMIKRCIDLCEYISFRDHGSRALVGQQENPEADVMPDLAFSKGYLTVADTVQVPHNRLKIGINPMPVFDKRYWPVSDDQKYRTYIENLADVHMMLMNSGFDPFFYNTQHSDLLVIEDVVASIAARTHASAATRDGVKICRSDTLDGLMKVIAAADIIVPTRFHGIILAYMADKPVVGICYGPKSKELITTVSRARFAFDVETFKAQQIIDETNRIADHYADETERISTVRQRYESLLQDQYRRIFN